MIGRIWVLGAVAALIAGAPASVAAQMSAAEKIIIGSERRDIGDFCGTMEFLDGFIREVDIDADGITDYMTDRGFLVCDGSQSGYCGSGGCTQTIWRGGADGVPVRIAEFLAYGLDFDRPEERTFAARLHGSSCGGTGPDFCMHRYRIVGDGVEFEREIGPRPGFEIWGYDETARRASIRPLVGQELALRCVGGRIEVGLLPGWLREDPGRMEAVASAAARDGGVAVRFTFDRDGLTMPFAPAGDGERFVGARALEADDPLLAALAGEPRLDVGMDAASTGFFTLEGSSRAIRSLLADCG